eukprot:1156608-Pelagomonas_calceolata.AAC.7
MEMCGNIDTKVCGNVSLTMYYSPHGGGAYLTVHGTSSCSRGSEKLFALSRQKLVLRCTLCCDGGAHMVRHMHCDRIG